MHLALEVAAPEPPDSNEIEERESASPGTASLASPCGATSVPWTLFATSALWRRPSPKGGVRSWPSVRSRSRRACGGRASTLARTHTLPRAIATPPSCRHGRSTKRSRCHCLRRTPRARPLCSGVETNNGMRASRNSTLPNKAAHRCGTCGSSGGRWSRGRARRKCARRTARSSYMAACGPCWSAAAVSLAPWVVATPAPHRAAGAAPVRRSQP
mmetsp:Transcript_56432/g.157288  ORF Transcript_56432/g.157288 Transcript_56432/m.157288 type:complete len:214 (+) Transcript_56432:961-1602(+)